tara:strand:+ start:1114 stop:1476 length:363 start_codon:yes stop_codon:yes gene_type:complete
MNRVRLYEEFVKRSPLVGILKTKYAHEIDKLHIFEDDDSIEFNQVVIRKHSRNIGIGSDILKTVTEYADRVGKIVTLTAADDYGSDLKRLKKFYQRFGFIFNHGKNRNFKYRDTMLRYPG